MRSFKYIMVLVIWITVQTAYGINLGVIGPTYPIGEESALDMMMKILAKKARTGELKQLQEKAIRRSMQSIKQMKPVGNVTTVRARSQQWIDPTVIYTKSITTDEGGVVIPAGTKINPLDRVSLTKTLVFFDGRDPEQQEAVGRFIAAQGPLKVKPILVAGSWLDLTRAWKTQVFYDQQGTLSKRFGITAVPALIRQHGRMLVRDEIPARELK